MLDFVNMHDCSIFEYLRRIRHFISRSATITLANALVSSRLDYCNSLFCSITKKEMKRLQGIQNTLCRIIHNLSGKTSTTHARKSLHWLPIEFRTKFKTLCITYKALDTGQPPYLSSFLKQYSCTKETRRTNPNLKFLEVPRITRNCKNLNQFHLSFKHAAPSLWNSLPLIVRNAPSFGSFRSRLKAHLVSLAFPP